MGGGALPSVVADTVVGASFSSVGAVAAWGLSGPLARLARELYGVFQWTAVGNKGILRPPCFQDPRSKGMGRLRARRRVLDDAGGSAAPRNFLTPLLGAP